MFSNFLLEFKVSVKHKIFYPVYISPDTILDVSHIAVKMTQNMKEDQGRNQTEMTEFILLGLSDDPDLQGVLFALFLSMYMVILMGNLGMIALIRLEPHLPTPMYLFLSSLSFLEASYSSSVTLKMLANLVKESKAISWN